MADDKFTEQALKHLEALKDAATAKGLAHQAIADRIGWERGNVSRVLRGAYIPKFDNFLKLADAIGINVHLMDQSSLHERPIIKKSPRKTKEDGQ